MCGSSSAQFGASRGFLIDRSRPDAPLVAVSKLPWQWALAPVALGALALVSAGWPARRSASVPAATASALSLPPPPASAGAQENAPAPPVAGAASVLDARRQLYESVDSLLETANYEAARRLLDEDAERHADDRAPAWQDLEQSYRLIADCLEHPSDRLRVRARAFALVSEAQGIKPRLLATCDPRR